MQISSNRKFWGFTEKGEYRCTTTNLPLCNDTVIVLKITLHHSVSIITNFLIPKRDKKQTKTSPFFVYSRRTTHDPHHTWHGDRGGPCHFCTPITFLIRSVVSLLGAKKHFLTTGPLSKCNTGRPALGNNLQILFTADKNRNWQINVNWITF